MLYFFNKNYKQNPLHHAIVMLAIVIKSILIKLYNLSLMINHLCIY